MKHSIRKKIVSMVVLAVTLAFTVSDIVVTVYFYGVQKRNTVEGEGYKLRQAAEQLGNFQEKISGIAKQIVVNEELQRLLREETKEDVFQRLIVGNAVKRICRTFINEQSYIYGVTIITEEGGSYSSNMTEEDFVPEMEAWYLAFKECGKSSGFSPAHTYISEQGNQRMEAVSYIMSFRDVWGHHEILGDIILHVSLKEIASYAQLPSALLAGVALYDGWGQALMTRGEISPSYGEVRELAEMENELANNNILLKNDRLADGWILAAEVSNQLVIRQLRSVPLFFFLIFLAATLALSVVLYGYIHTITKPIEALHQAAIEVGKGDLDVEVDIRTSDELAVLGKTFNQMISDIKRKMEEMIAYEKAAKEQEIDRLMLQINPHFIYNTLNSIVYMAQIQGNQDIVKFANAFISLLQATLRVGREDTFISLEQEIQNIKNYLLLQSYRYPQLFDVVYDIDEGLYGCRIPNVLIQPIVENAIFHGMAGRLKRGTLRLLVTGGRERVEIVVEDDGLGMEPEVVEQLLGEGAVGGRMHKIGVANVKKRIETIYGEGYGIRIDSQVGRGTRVALCIPYEEYEVRE